MAGSFKDKLVEEVVSDSKPLHRDKNVCQTSWKEVCTILEICVWRKVLEKRSVDGDVPTGCLTIDMDYI